MACNMNNNVANAADDMKAARKYVDRLIDDGAAVPVDDDETSYKMLLPEWYDADLYKRAQRYYHANIFAMFSGMLIGLLAVLAVPTILRVLTFTKGSSTPMTAYRRYLQTILHTMSWYDDDLKPGTRSWRSLEAVRQRHVRVSQKSQKSQNAIISQKDMALTQFGFVGFILIKPHLLGVQVTRDDHEALVHFWRVIGHMIGIRDEYNLLTDSWATTRPRLQLIMADVYRPSLSHTTDEFYRMADHLLRGLWCFNPFLSTPVHIYLAKMIAGCDGYVYFDSDPAMLEQSVDAVVYENRQNIGWSARYTLWLFVTLHSYGLNFSWVRWYMNAQIYLSSVIIRWFPFLAIYMFGVRQAYVRILGE